MRHVGKSRRAGDHDFHLEELDERFGACAQAVVFEQRLLFERVEVEILAERVDQIFVRQRCGRFRIGTGFFDGGRQQRLELRSLPSDGVAILAPAAASAIQRLDLGAIGSAAA